jgi:hypothetical protein
VVSLATLIITVTLALFAAYGFTRCLRLSGTNLHPKSNSVSIVVSENGEICAFKNLLFIRKTNGRIEQTMKIENARVNTKVLVATRAKRR